MAKGGKKKTTFAKHAREHRLRERRIDKQAKKDARKQASAAPPVDLVTDGAGAEGSPSTHLKGAL
jgi:hypothetical protein